MFAHFVRAWPDAPVYTALYDERAVGDLVPAERVRTSFLQRFPLRERAFRAYAPLYPRAFESFDLSAFDVVVSSTTAWAKGVIVRPDAVHVCYINTVSRFVFDAERYVGGFGGGALARPLLKRLAAWDVRAAQRPTRLVANSRNVADRVRRWYGRDADVLPCPVDVDRFTPGAGNGDYFVVVSRLLPYKRIDLAIAACALAGVPLHVVGAGPDERRLKALALRNAHDVSRRGGRRGAQRARRRRARGDPAGRRRLRARAAGGGGGGPPDDRVRRRRRARDDRRRRDGRVLSRARRRDALARRDPRVRSGALRSRAAARARRGSSGRSASSRACARSSTTTVARGGGA